MALTRCAAALIINMHMIEGKCPKCGTHRFGWALLNARYQTCPACGAGLDIYKDGVLVARGFSPFSADRLDAEPQPETPSTPLNEDEQ